MRGYWGLAIVEGCGGLTRGFAEGFREIFLSGVLTAVWITRRVLVERLRQGPLPVVGDLLQLAGAFDRLPYHFKSVTAICDSVLEAVKLIYAFIRLKSGLVIRITRAALSNSNFLHR